MDAIQIARQVFDVEASALAFVRDTLDERFQAAVSLLLATLSKGGKIVVTGVGKNLHIAEKISATLASTGSTSVVLNPSQAIHGDLGVLAAPDVLVALSYSGDSEEIKNLIPAVRRLGIPIIALTGSPDSILGSLSEVVVPVTVPREACPFNMAPTASTTATLAMGDALAMALLDARGFRREDYAKLHPGGAIGRALLYRAADIMRQGDGVAMVGSEASVRDVLIAMTRARAGSACVVDAQGLLLGIFTDGDFRRHVATNPALPLATPIADLMTRNPLRVQSGQLAVDVLQFFERHKIDDLPVVDETGHLVGSIDIQDLPRLKVF